jgi:hypothetical protein
MQFSTVPDRSLMFSHVRVEPLSLVSPTLLDRDQPPSRTVYLARTFLRSF